jgi:magnesium-transporting ATPase (P-type)
MSTVIDGAVNISNIFFGILLYFMFDTIEVRTFFRESSEKIQLTFGLENVPERIAMLLFIVVVLCTMYLSIGIYSRYMKIISHEKCGWGELPYLWWLPILIVGLVTFSILYFSIHISLAFTIPDFVRALVIIWFYDSVFMDHVHEAIEVLAELSLTTNQSET